MGSDKYRKDEAPGRFDGELAAPPRGPLATALLALTGILLLIEVGRLVLRYALALRRPVEVRIVNQAFELRAKTIMLGRLLREQTTLLPIEGLVRTTRDVRYPSLPVYAGLLALTLGSYLGVGLAVDGARAASPSMLATGLLIALAGLTLDFALSSLVPGMRGRTRVVLVPRRGPVLCVQSVDPSIADRVLAELVTAKRVPSVPSPAPVETSRTEHGSDVAEEDSARET
jgi:hypothetical protein